MDLNLADIEEEVLDFIIGEVQAEVRILTVADDRLYIYKEKTFVPDELDFQTTTILIHPEDAPGYVQMFNDISTGKVDKNRKTFRARSGDGTYRHYRIQCMRHADQQGETDYILFTRCDVTAHIMQSEKHTELVHYTNQAHLINQNCGITFWRYNPYTRIFHNIDPYLDEYEPDMSAEQLLQFTHPDDKETVSKYLERSESLCTEMQQFHCSCAWENGMDYHYYKFIQIPFLDGKGKLLEYGIARIDETQKAETDRMLRISQRVGRIGSWSIDYQMDKCFCSEELQKLLEMDEYTPGFSIRNYVHEDDKDEYDRIIAENKEKGTDYSFIMRFNTAAGRIKWMEFQAIAIKNIEDKTVGYYGTLTDVTDIYLARLKAEESDRLKTAFLANMSHEIRTPLNAIVGFSDILATEEISPEDKKAFGNIIRSNNEQLLTLINDILDLSNLESGSVKFVKTSFDVEELMNEIYASYHPKFKDLPVKFVYIPKGKHITMCQDRQRLTTVLTNFVNNAIKYTDKGSITIGYQEEDEGVKFTVTDTGTGIPSDMLDKIFNRFEKLGSLVKGTGLGLSICKTLSDRMHGTIGVESVPGEGSTFWFRLGLK
ncbi:sensor histidine kinase [Bacteroides zoogleoformans]|uniref:sensor histidine kinase n=1 Tax=Bacteroides zoogleoformans TaxID=28119 RepID=UPI00248D561B|nr:ATP-binding protein [Bacteroides zoogleoformans]